MKKLAMALCVCLLCVFCFSALAEDRTLTVTGTATVRVNADRARVMLGVRTTAEDARKAAETNAEKMDLVLNALEEAGIPRENMTTDYYYVSALYDYSSYTEEERIRGYQVSNTLSVLVEDIDRVGAIIDIALSQGANTCDGVSFQSTGAGEAYDEALRAAIAEGRRKAALVAESCGKTLGDLVEISENYGSYRGVSFKSAYAEEDAGAFTSTSITSDGLDFSATVTMTFAFGDGLGE